MRLVLTAFLWTAVLVGSGAAVYLAAAPFRPLETRTELNGRGEVERVYTVSYLGDLHGEDVRYRAGVPVETTIWHHGEWIATRPAVTPP